MELSINYNQSRIVGMNVDGCVDVPLPICHAVRCFMRYEQDAPIEDSDLCIHSMAIIYVCIEGRGRIYHNNNVLELNDGEALLVMPQQRHVRLPFNDNKVTYLVIRFEPDQSSSIFTLLSGHVLTITERARMFLNEFIISYQKAFDRDDYESSVRTLLYLSLFFNSMHHEIGNSAIPSGLPLRVERACQAIFTGGDNYKTFQEIASDLQVTPNYLRNCIKHAVGHSPKELRDIQSKLKAEQMLLNTDATIGEIAQNLNFNSIYSFSRFFKRQLGCSPTEYRNKYRKD